jgi:hypothetical protein
MNYQLPTKEGLKEIATIAAKKTMPPVTPEPYDVIMKHIIMLIEEAYRKKNRHVAFRGDSLFPIKSPGMFLSTSEENAFKLVRREMNCSECYAAHFNYVTTVFYFYLGSMKDGEDYDKIESNLSDYQWLLLLLSFMFFTIMTVFVCMVAIYADLGALFSGCATFSLCGCIYAWECFMAAGERRRVFIDLQDAFKSRMKELKDYQQTKKKSNPHRKSTIKKKSNPQQKSTRKKNLKSQQKSTRKKNLKSHRKKYQMQKKRTGMSSFAIRNKQ